MKVGGRYAFPDAVSVECGDGLSPHVDRRPPHRSLSDSDGCERD